jgi:hypothetical protein
MEQIGEVFQRIGRRQMPDRDIFQTAYFEAAGDVERMWMKCGKI